MFPKTPGISFDGVGYLTVLAFLCDHPVPHCAKGGQRRLRIHNLAFETCSQLADVYRSCDTDTLINCLAKMSLPLLNQKTIAKIREDTSAQVAQVD